MHFLRTILAKPPPSADRRTAPRNRTRLRPGKLLDADLRFIEDCAILDRSPGGTRLRLFAAVGAPTEPVAVFDENEGSIRRGRVAWRGRREIGLRLDPGSETAGPDLLRRLSGPYYAVRD